MGGDMPDNGGGWGGQDIDMDGSLEVGRDGQEETPWAHTPSVSTLHRSVSTPSIGEAFAFETPRMYVLFFTVDYRVGPWEVWDRILHPLKILGEQYCWMTMRLQVKRKRKSSTSTSSKIVTNSLYSYMKDIMQRADTDHVFLFDLIHNPHTDGHQGSKQQSN